MTRREWLGLMGAGLTPEAGSDALRRQWRAIARDTDGTVGAAALHLSSGSLVSLNGDVPFPLASVCKIPIAMNMLALVDEGKLREDEEIEVLARDVWAGVSEIEKRWPAQRRFPLREMLRLMVAESDNTAVETMFRVGGGAAPIARRLKGWGIQGLRVDRSERQCALDRNGVRRYPPPKEWTDARLNRLMEAVPEDRRYQAMLQFLSDPRDTGTPRGTVQLLAKLFRGQALSEQSTALLIDSMKATTTFPTRLKGLLPNGTVVAHKTGSLGTVGSMAAATNDSGVIFLPEGGRLAISVYLEASTRTAGERDRIIARMARAAFDARGAMN